MRILGFDQATAVCGFGVIDVVDGAPTYVACGVLQAPKDWERFRRLHEIHRDLQATIAEYLTDDTHVVVEGGVARFAAPALAGGEARGIVLAPAFAAGVPWERIHELAPTSMKLAIAGNGKATKAQIAATVQLQLRMRHRPELDAADALGLALAWARGVRGTRSKKRPRTTRMVASQA